MAVPTSFTGLSTTPGSNSPVAGDNVFPDLDDFLRIVQAMLASIYANTSTNGWVSPYTSEATSTFTPTAVGNVVAGTTTYVGQEGTYTKLGTRVWFELAVQFSSATGSGGLVIGGLPFTASSSGSYDKGAFVVRSDAGVALVATIVGGTTTMSVAEAVSGSAHSIPSGAAIYRIAGFYLT